MNLSIGALAAATGVPPNTLRTWERRYGFPPSERTGGGQRVYPAEVVEHVRAVKRALDLGFRPSNVMGAPLDELHAMIARARPEPVRRVPLTLVSAPSDTIATDEWLTATADLDGARLEGAFVAGLEAAGSLPAFVRDAVVPFLGAVGQAWMDGELSPYQEHFASERLREFLVARWRPIADTNTGPVGVLASLPGEQHDLGLHMVACLLAVTGWQVVYLGADTPVPDIVAATRTAGARAVFVSSSAHASLAEVRWNLGLLRERIEPAIAVVGGGQGLPTDVQGVLHPSSLDALREWLQVEDGAVAR